MLGDAGHAMLPFLGQGLNSGLEDVCLLLDCLDQEKGTVQNKQKIINNIFIIHIEYKPCHEKNEIVPMRKQRCRSVISAFVFAIQIVQFLFFLIVQFLFFLNPKFQASSHLL